MEASHFWYQTKDGVIPDGLSVCLGWPNGLEFGKDTWREAPHSNAHMFLYSNKISQIKNFKVQFFRYLFVKKKVFFGNSLYIYLFNVLILLKKIIRVFFYRKVMLIMYYEISEL